ncbi:hypothetical protein INS49_011570 [Diaporthe citri]|uniref:uncharacterized protein n=1 Tax=Diaporthe citri TaxID=83186 RepID=UPI001C821056|nr:uncharacterized protein INS49_011570 [Diaporthe citri]KAG6360508.1 hypothetical protein INS49_011570 [Diaporthe citri]
MKSAIILAFVATLLPRGAVSAPVPVSIAAVELGQSGYNHYVSAAARDELSTAGRSGYNSVEVTARDATTAAETDGRSGYNSIDVSTRAVSTGFETDGRSGYNSIEIAERDSTTNAETAGRSGYNSVEVVERTLTTDAETEVLKMSVLGLGGGVGFRYDEPCSFPPSWSQRLNSEIFSTWKMTTGLKDPRPYLDSPSDTPECGHKQRTRNFNSHKS